MADRSPGLGLRARLVLLTTAGLAAGLLIGGIVLTVVLRSGLERASDDAARQTAHDVAALIDSGRLPDPIPTGGTTLVQVVDGQGRVVATSAGADRLVPALAADQRSAAITGPLTVAGSAFGIQGPVRVVALPAGTGDGASTVIVAAPAGDIDQAVGVLRISLVAGFAVLLAVAALVAWRLVGATLRPVESLRTGAAKITGTGSTDTLPVPHANDEIRRLAVTLNDMLARLASSRRRQRAFVADAAHELRSPLTSLRTQLEVAAATGEQPDMDDVLAEVGRLGRLVDDLLVLARIDDARPVERAPFDVAAVARRVVSRFDPARVPVSFRARPTPIVGPEADLDRITTNLIDNAVRHAGTLVTVTVEPGPDGSARLDVVDDGPGIPAEQRERVFERFTRLDEARDRDSGGSGLGLAIVRELITRLGGSVTMSDAAPGHTPTGLRVEVRLGSSGSARG